MGRHILISEIRIARAVMIVLSLLLALDIAVFLYMLFSAGWSSTPISSLPGFYWILLAGFIMGILAATFALPKMFATVSSSRDKKSQIGLTIMNLVLGGLFVLDAIFFNFRADGSHVYRFLIGLTLLVCAAWDLRQARITKRVPGA